MICQIVGFVIVWSVRAPKSHVMKVIIIESTEPSTGYSCRLKAQPLTPLLKVHVNVRVLSLRARFVFATMLLLIKKEYGRRTAVL